MVSTAENGNHGNHGDGGGVEGGELQPTASQIFRQYDPTTMKQITSAAGMLVVGTPDRRRDVNEDVNETCEPAKKRYRLRAVKSDANSRTPSCVKNKRKLWEEQGRRQRRKRSEWLGSLSVMNEDEVELVLTNCDARTLATLSCTCSYFAPIAEEVARRKVIDAHPTLEPNSNETWMSLLNFLTASERAREAEKLVGLGSYHTALINNEHVYTCGRGFHGQLGNGQYDNVSVPERVVDVFSEGEKPVAVACGSSHNAVISSSGRMFTWGLASSGELGHGGWTPIELNIPKALSCLSAVKISSISCGSNHTVAISSCGSVWTCGRGRNGQLGHGSLHDEGPMKKVEAMANHRAVKASAGGTHTMVLCGDGRVFSWGNNLYGQLGHQEDSLSLFKSVAIPQEIVALRSKTGKSQERIVSLSAGARHSLAVTANGVLFVWGENSYGCLGLGDNVRRPIPTRVRFHELLNSREENGTIRCIHACAGGHHSAALVYDSRTCKSLLLTAGCNNYGQLGHNDQNNRKSFVVLAAGEKKRIVSISCGESSCAAQDDSGGLYLWGRGELGQLGTNDCRSHFLPVKI